MSLFEVKDLKFKYTDKDLFNQVSFRLLPEEHAVLVGDNGVGKTTLMNIIAKNLIPDSGMVSWLPNIKFSYLDQHLKVDYDMVVSDYLYDAYAFLFEKERKMLALYKSLETASENQYDRILRETSQIEEELEKNNFYNINSKIGNVINGLGISDYALTQNLRTLSGGQKEKVFLAKMLLEEPDVLLMDEPTNFLDIPHIDWLIKYLNSFKGAFLVISHDESFLRSIAKVVFCLKNKVVERYKGNYDFFLEEKQLRESQYLNAYNNQQKFIKQTEFFIQKNIVRATSSKAAKSRRKMLEHLEILDKPASNEHIHINFPYSGTLGEEVLKLMDVVVGYSYPLLNPLTLTIRHNEKVAIVGENGVGKSTLIKTLMNIIPTLSGSFKFNNSGVINYFSQEEEYFSITPLEYLKNFYPEKLDKELRSVLASLGIKANLIDKKMTELSGGEQTKVRLALMTLKKANILILDEPTNHLDPYAKEELLEALDVFDGSVIIVSHEKDLFDNLVDYYIELK